MRDLDSRRMVRRAVGRQAIERSIRSLLLRVHRFGQHRARSAADALWAARVVDELREFVREPEPDDEGQPRSIWGGRRRPAACREAAAMTRHRVTSRAKTGGGPRGAPHGAGGRTRTVGLPRAQKKSRGKKKATRRRRGLSRIQLARELGIGLTSVDRLIAFGLKSVGLRGPAKLYSLSAAKQLAKKLAPAESAAAEVLVSDFATHAEDLRDRRHQLLETTVQAATWRPQWLAVLRFVERMTAEWPDRLSDRLGEISREEAELLPWADGPRVGDASRYPQPVIRPLLQDLSDAFEHSAEASALEQALLPPAREAAVMPPKTVEDARAQWREARSAFRQTRVAVRRGCVNRAALVARITAAIATFRATWWSARGQAMRVAGDPAAVRQWATQIRAETLKRLATLDGGGAAGAAE